MREIWNSSFDLYTWQGPYFLEHLVWIEASFGIWAGDRLIRLLRVWYLNIAWSPSNGLRLTQARISRQQGDLTELLIVPARNWSFTPGQYLFLHVQSRPWESHPFTIVSYAHTADRQRTDSDSVSDDDMKLQGAIGLAAADQPKTIKLLIKQHGGMTKRLAAACSSSDLKQAVVIEGPYGTGLNLGRYDNVRIFSITSRLLR